MFQGNNYFVMTNGTVSGNVAQSVGGGGLAMYDANQYFNLTGVTITGNRVLGGGFGGGVFLHTGMS